MEEIWKGIIGYEEVYQVSNLGNVRSLNYMNHGFAKNLVPKINNRNRLWVELNSNGIKRVALIHRLVAEAFIPNPDNLPQINHKDENPHNNCVDNLEWCTGEYNIKYSMNRHPERSKSRKHYPKYRRMLDRKIAQVNLDGTVEKVWDDCRSIFLETGMSQWSISQCCDGKRKVAYGFRWQYAI